MIAGVNGAGKSTLFQTVPSLHNMPRINADEILREAGGSGDPADMLSAGKEAVERITQYFDKEITFNQETTLCGRLVIRNIERARKTGYFVELHYVGVDSVDIAKERVSERVKKGGHDIPERDIERRYISTFNNLKVVLPKCDLAAFYDNTIVFRRFAIYRNGQMVRLSHHVPKWYGSYVADNR